MVKLLFGWVYDVWLLKRYLAFAKAIISEPPFEAVIHTASPFHYNATDVKRDLYDPGTESESDILVLGRNLSNW